jgi:hypothetical protein
VPFGLVSLLTCAVSGLELDPKNLNSDGISSSRDESSDGELSWAENTRVAAGIARNDPW